MMRKWEVWCVTCTDKYSLNVDYMFFTKVLLHSRTDIFLNSHIITIGLRSEETDMDSSLFII
jgi:hypothetical protein